MYLKSYKWKTHICRGIFSNQVAGATNNIGEIALWRGDSSMTSALTYLNNKEEVGKDVEKILDELLIVMYILHTNKIMFTIKGVTAYGSNR